MTSAETTDGEPTGTVDRSLEQLVGASETAMEVLELLTGVVLVFLFGIGLYDLVVDILESIRSGAAFEVANVVDFIDTVLLLLIIVEVFRTVVAFSRDVSIVRIIIDASLVAVARKVIGFRPDRYASTDELFVNTLSIAVLLLAVIVAFYIIRKTTEPGEEVDMPAAGSVELTGADASEPSSADAAGREAGGGEGTATDDDGQ